jgi:predicted transcriptional regulator
MTTDLQKRTAQSESLHVRVRPEVLENIDQIAGVIGRSRNWVLNEALENYLDLQKWQLDLIKERRAEAEQQNAEFIDHTEVMERQKKRLRKKLGV